MAIIFSDTLPNNGGNNGGVSNRQVLTLTGNSLGQVRVSFQSRPSAGVDFAATHCSIGKSNGTTMETIATPVELLFGGLSGFSGTSPVTFISDYVNFSANNGDNVVVIMDQTPATGSSAGFSNPAPSGCNWYSLAAESSYNKANPTADGSWAANPSFNIGVLSIETQAAPTTASLMPQICM